MSGFLGFLPVLGISPSIVVHRTPVEKYSTCAIFQTFTSSIKSQPFSGSIRSLKFVVVIKSVNCNG